MRSERDGEAKSRFSRAIAREEALADPAGGAEGLDAFLGGTGRAQAVFEESAALPAESVLRPVDTAFIAYLIVSGLLAALFLFPRPLGAVLAAAHALAALLVPPAVRFLEGGKEKWREFLRAWYPVLFFFILYVETSLINKGSPVPFLDPWLSHMDDVLFGAQLSEYLPANIDMPWFQEAMAASYFSYYLLIPGGGLYLWIRNRKRFPTFLFTVAACFYFCYVLFIVLPAGGPQQYLRAGHIHWNGVVFGPLLTEMLGALEVDTGAFPSSHVAVALIVLVFLWREGGGVRYVVALLFLGLFGATVYGGPHYALDLPAGILVGAAFLRYAPRLERALAGRRAAESGGLEGCGSGCGSGLDRQKEKGNPGRGSPNSGS